MNTCVAYFSKSGNTEIAAEYLAEKIGATAIALKDGTTYKGVLGFVKGGMNASLAKQNSTTQSLSKLQSLSVSYSQHPYGQAKQHRQSTPCSRTWTSQVSRFT